MGDRDTRQTVRVLVGGLVVAVVAAWAYFARLDDQPWFADESAYIAQTYYYHLLFHEGDLWHEDWQRRGGIAKQRKTPAVSTARWGYMIHNGARGENRTRTPY